MFLLRLDIDFWVTRIEFIKSHYQNWEWEDMIEVGR